MLAEALNLALAPQLGRAESKQVIKEACEIALAENRHLVDVLREQVSVEIDWDNLRDEGNYLGVSDAMIDKVLGEVKGKEGKSTKF
jgi:3-carboxy-cis,cis-muconate cycloisomerase